MRYHTATHVLTGVMFNDFHVRVTGNQLTPDKGRVDFAFEQFDRDVLEEGFRRANAIVAQDLAVRVSFVPAARARAQAELFKLETAFRHDLQGRSAYQPTIHQQRGRFVAYVGHHGGRAPNPLTGADEDNGTSIVDVTDPARPRYLAHIPGMPGGPEQGGAQMARVCDRQGKSYLLRTFGNSGPGAGHEGWDVTAPRRPRQVD